MIASKQRRSGHKSGRGTTGAAPGEAVPSAAGHPADSLRAFPEKRPRDLLDNTIFLVMDIGRLYRSIFDAKMEPLGLPRQEWWMLAYLCYFDGSTQQRLADVMDIDKGAMAKLVGRLEEKGLIQRVADPKDARQKRIYFTAEARAFAARIDNASVRLATESSTALGEGDLPTLNGLLRLLRESLLRINENSQFGAS